MTNATTPAKKKHRAIHYAPCGKIACAARHSRSIGAMAESTLDAFLALEAAWRCSRCEKTATNHMAMRLKKAGRAA